MQETSKQRDAHERAKRILLGDENVFSRRTHSTDMTPSSDIDETVANPDAAPEEDEDEAEKKFSELMEMFSSSKGKGKGKAVTRKAVPPVAGPSRSRTQKKVEELGPSGQPYTPFELQVSYILVRNSLIPHTVFRFANSKPSTLALCS